MTVSRIFSSKMAVKMGLFWFSFVLAFIGSNALGEFNVLYSPDSVKFSSSGKAQESVLKEVFSAALGLSVEESCDWTGITVWNPFNTPEAAVEVYVDGVSSLGDEGLSRVESYKLIVDEYEPDTYDALRHRIQQRFASGVAKLVNIKLSEPNELTAYEDVFGKMAVPKVTKQSLQHLKYSIEEDYEFLVELETLNEITKRIASGAVSADNVVDFYNFRFRSLHALSDIHGPNSLQTKEAKKLLNKSIQDLSDAFVKAYDGSVLVSTVTTDVAHTRRTVRAVRDDGAPEPDPTTTASTTTTTKAPATKGADDDYPAIFNIILWFCVAFAFSLVAIVYAIMDMDPGRDSIIYRMTSTRIKKE